jgi:hypothetical protein
MLSNQVFNNNDSISNYVLKLFPNKPVNIWSLRSDELNKLKSFINDELMKIHENPFIQTALYFNGQNRFDLEGDQSNIVEPFLFTNRPSIDGLNIKSYSRITHMTHMGYLNLSGAHNMRLEYRLSGKVIDGDVNVILNTYQILRIASGFGTALWR